MRAVCVSNVAGNTQSVPRSKHSVSVIKTSQLMLYREIIAVCSQLHTNTLCGQKAGCLVLTLAVSIVSDHWALIAATVYRPAVW